GAEPAADQPHPGARHKAPEIPKRRQRVVGLAPHGFNRFHRHRAANDTDAPGVWQFEPHNARNLTPETERFMPSSRAVLPIQLLERTTARRRTCEASELANCWSNKEH